MKDEFIVEKAGGIQSIVRLGVGKAIFTISTLGLVFAMYLVISEIAQPGFCPTFLQIPACYIVLVAFLLVSISCLVRNRLFNWVLFDMGATVGLFLAIWFSRNQFLGLKECPKLLDIPMCYGSFIIFLSLWVMKIREFIREK